MYAAELFSTANLLILTIVLFLVAAVVRAVAHSIDGTLIAIGLMTLAWAFYLGLP
jgi:hypothetical protein